MLRRGCNNDLMNLKRSILRLLPGNVSCRLPDHDPEACSACRSKDGRAARTELRCFRAGRQDGKRGIALWSCTVDVKRKHGRVDLTIALLSGYSIAEHRAPGSPETSIHGICCVLVPRLNFP